MTFLKNLDKYTKTLLLIGVICVLYGYIARIVEIYFFWESKQVGWALILAVVIRILMRRIKLNKENNKKTIIEKIGIGVMVLFLLLMAGFVFLIPFSGAFKASEQYLYKYYGSESSIGRIKSITSMTTGAIEINNGYGTASLSLLVKGEHKYVEITVYSTKNPDDEAWKVMAIEE